MKFILNTYNLFSTDDELLDDLRETAKKLFSPGGKQGPSIDLYNKRGKFNATTIIRRFGTWNKALKRAGLKINKGDTISDRDLFTNLKKVWKKLRRQPAKKDMVMPLSDYTYEPYRRKFGSWLAALAAFVEHQDRKSALKPKLKNGKNRLKVKKQNRNISISLRYNILRRDKYKCRICGSSPAVDPKIILHVDHIIPYSKGGKTTPGNLQTLCSNCNIGKGTKSMSN